MRQEERLAACDILKYLQKHPQAKHTSEGIARYWIHQQRLAEKLGIVLAAIDYLVSEGFLNEVKKEDDQKYYRFNIKKMNELAFTIERLQRKDEEQSLKERYRRYRYDYECEGDEGQPPPRKPPER